jgi:hypothetical protein
MAGVYVPRVSEAVANFIQKGKPIRLAKKITSLIPSNPVAMIHHEANVCFPV